MRARIFIAAAISVLIAGPAAAEPLKAKPDRDVMEQLNGSWHVSEDNGNGAVSGWGEDLPPIDGSAFNSKPRLGKDGYVIRGPYRDSDRGSFPSSRACVFLVGKTLSTAERHAVSQCLRDLWRSSPHLSDQDMCRRCWP